jgi:catechol 2,3-dioxygenase-like lactoylglutathione lyase family enzyme
MTLPLLSAALLTGVLLAQAQPIPMRVSMISLGVKDTARSIQFYRDTLGMQFVGETEPGEVAIFQAGALQIALNRPLGNAAGSAIVGAVEVILSVDSVVTAHYKLADRGCNFIRKPREVFNGTWAATFTDPDGHRLTILGPR